MVFHWEIMRKTIGKSSRQATEISRVLTILFERSLQEQVWSRAGGFGKHVRMGTSVGDAVRCPPPSPLNEQHTDVQWTAATAFIPSPSPGKLFLTVRAMGSEELKSLETQNRPPELVRPGFERRLTPNTKGRWSSDLFVFCLNFPICNGGW